jgi:hypothetical protein
MPWTVICHAAGGTQAEGHTWWARLQNSFRFKLLSLRF